MSAPLCLPAQTEAKNFGQIPGTGYELTVSDESHLCGASTMFTNGIFVGMVYDTNRQSWYFSLAHDDWRFQEGGRYDARVSIDGERFYGDIRAIGKSMIAGYTSKEFLHAFTAGRILTVYQTSTGAPIASISLVGTSRMVDAVAHCAEVMQAQSQPFGSPKPEMPQEPFKPKAEMPQTPFAPKAELPSRRFAGPERGA